MAMVPDDIYAHWYGVVVYAVTIWASYHSSISCKGSSVPCGRGFQAISLVKR